MKYFFFDIVVISLFSVTVITLDQNQECISHC